MKWENKELKAWIDKINEEQTQQMKDKLDELEEENILLKSNLSDFNQKLELQASKYEKELAIQA